MRKFIQYWLSPALMREPERENRIIDHDILRFERLLRLREIAMQYASEYHNYRKLYQANRLIKVQTEKLNNKYHNSRTFNFN